MEPTGPTSGTGGFGKPSDFEKQPSDDPVESQTSEGDHLSSDLSQRATTTSQKPSFGLIRQAPVLVDSDDDSVERTFHKANTVKEAALVCHQVLADRELDSSRARQLQYGRFRCWEMTSNQGVPCTLIHAHPEWNLRNDFWVAVDDRKVTEIVNLSGLAPEYLELRRPRSYMGTLPDFPSQNELSLKVSLCQEYPEVRHYQLDGWPDGGRTNIEVLSVLIRHLAETRGAGGLMVHCQQGLGRTGCFVQLMLMMQALESGELNKDNAFQWFVGSLNHSRENRGFNQYVQNATQFQMLLEGLMQLTGVAEQQLVREVNQWAQGCGWEIEFS